MKTTDPLLGWIDTQCVLLVLSALSDLGGEGTEEAILEGVDNTKMTLLEALRSAIEFHLPTTDDLSDTVWCSTCYTVDNDGVVFPCPEYRKIADYLEVTI